MANQGPDKMNQLIKTIIFRWFISNDSHPSIQYPLIQYWQYQGSTIHHPDTIHTPSRHHPDTFQSPQYWWISYLYSGWQKLAAFRAPQKIQQNLR